MTLPSSSPDANRNPTMVVFDSSTKLPLGLTAQNLTNANALHVAIVDNTGTQITSFGGGTQYTAGAAQASPVGTLALGYDGANVRALLTNSAGDLFINIDKVGGSSPNFAQETGGNLATLAGAVTSSKVQINLSQVGGSAISLGQALAAASLPVILPSATITTLTPPSNTGYALDSSLSTIDTDLKSNVTLHAGSNIVGKVGIDQTTPGTTNGVSLQLDTTSGWSFNYQSALSNTKAQIKGSAGKFGGFINLYNPNTAVTYIQVFNKASGSVTVGTTAPDFVITLPGVATASATGSDRNLEITMGLAMNTGITIAATTTPTGNTGPANAIVGTFLFI